MLQYLLAFAIVWCIPIAWNVYDQFDSGLCYLLWMFAISPVLFSWITASLIRLRSPRVFLTKDCDCGMGRFVSGLVAGAASLILAIGGIVELRHSDFPDILTIISSTSLATGLVVLLSPRIKAGLCAQCRYDIRASIEFGRCPECGLAI